MKGVVVAAVIIAGLVLANSEVLTLAVLAIAGAVGAHKLLASY